jgi:rhomboid protease GluP
MAAAAHRPWATLAVLGALALAFAAEVVASAGAWKGWLEVPVATLVALGGVVSRRVVQGHEWWRLVAGPLLHGGLVHLALNGLVIGYAGWLVERRVGWARWVVLYGLGAGVGALGSTLANPDTTVSVGASGAGMALLAGLFVLSFREPKGPARTALQASSLRVLVPSLLPIATSGDAVDLAAHVGGALAGVAVGWVLLREPVSRPGGGVATALAAGVLGFTVAGVAFTAREVPAAVVQAGLQPAGELEGALKRTCALGSTAACVALGGALTTGEDELPQDVAAARGLLQGPCLAGQAVACFYLGLGYHRESPPRWAEAAAAYRRGCGQDELSACFNLAMVAPHVADAGDVEAEVRALLERSCRVLPRACAELVGHLEGDATVDAGRTVELAQRACEASEGRACLVAGRLTAAGRGTARDEVEGRELLERACQLDVAPGCTAAGRAWRRAGERARAQGFFERACQQQDLQGCLEADGARRDHGGE